MRELIDLSICPSSLSVGIHRPHSSNIYFLKTTGLMEAKFHMEPPRDRGTNICSNSPGQTTKIAATLIYLYMYLVKAI